LLPPSLVWIDALCIIQAIEGVDDSDWRIEASHMEQVFGSAYCTIAASSAEDWTKGFLEWKSTRRSVQDVLDALKDGSLLLALSESPEDGSLLALSKKRLKDRNTQPTTQKM